MQLNTRYWLRLSLLNLSIVAFFGALMRYKIGFEFPYLNQKNIQYAHSHFAFLGWITHTIYVLMLHRLQEKDIPLNHRNYRFLIIGNLLCAYGMMLSFLASGYGFASIAISGFSIIIGYAFSYSLYRDIKRLPEHHSVNWFRAGLVFNAISSLGTFVLAYIIGAKHFNQNWYLASLYFYLHFQYNGFFTFACIGLLLFKLPYWLPAFQYPKMTFGYFFSACVPAYFLSTLWAGLPLWLYAIVVLSALLQLAGWLKLFAAIRKAIPSQTRGFRRGYFLFSLVALAFTLKLCLQMGSTIPVVSKLAFGFRPIVIAYLHLILLAIISLFLLGYIYASRLIQINRKTHFALLLFVTGVFANELVLAIQGVAAFSYTTVPFCNELLFIIALVILCGIGVLFALQKKNKVVAPEM